MNRLQSFTVKHQPDIENYLIENGIYYEVADECPQLAEHVIFLEYIDLNVLDFDPVIISGLSAWTDTGIEEIHITGNEYELFDNLYLVRKGTYDPVIDEMI